jgi:hypothetical protein
MIRINGVDYELRFDLYAMEQIEDEFGNLKSVFDMLRSGEKQVKLIRALFRIMANSALSYAGKPETVTGDELKHLPIPRLREVGEAARRALDEGMKVEMSNGGEADDDIHDGYLEEIERKKD